jgi:outer membrane receptor protein involved in Fe transport
MFNDSNTQAHGSYLVTNFRAGLRGKNWSVEGWARNAFDEQYSAIMFSSQFPLAPGNSGTLVEPGAPATFGVSANLRF